MVWIMFLQNQAFLLKAYKHICLYAYIQTYMAPYKHIWLLTRDFVLADLLVRSPRTRFLFILKEKYILG